LKRDIDAKLSVWKTKKDRRPLLIKGARQVGKSTSIEAFGKSQFDKVVSVNFEQRPEFKNCFESLIPQEIIESISLLSKTDITAGDTLLFLDEIQECPEAIMAMRYFYEQMPDLHVIGAGSLLEFALKAENFRMPVGRVEFEFMNPMSFGEFLCAIGEEALRNRVRELRNKPLPSSVHDRLMGYIQKYALLGGMPAVIKYYIQTGKINGSLDIQSTLSQGFIADFGKYSSKIRQKYILKIFQAVPKMVGRKFKFSNVDSTIQSRDLKEALELLEMAGIVQIVRATSGSGLPLKAEESERIFKVLFLDIGIMQNMCGLSRELGSKSAIMQINKGALAEQLIGQELLCIQPSHQPPTLHYWSREQKNSSAEIDYLIAIDDEPVPIEVKSGKRGTLKSLTLFKERYSPRWMVRFYSSAIEVEGDLVSLPLYASESLNQRLGTAL